MVEIIDWTHDVVRPLDATYFIQWVNRDAGSNLLGVPQVVGPETSFWRIDLTIPRDFDGQRMRDLEALVSEMRGRKNIANLDVCDPYRYGSNVSPYQWPFDDGTYFSDGTGFQDPNAGVHETRTATAMAAGGTEVTIETANPTRPAFRRGDMFSRNGFLYRVVRRTDGGWAKIEPPAREAIGQGAALRTDPPRIYCRFIDDSQGMRIRERLRWGSQITLSFVEAFDR